MTDRISVALPHLRALNILSHLPPGDHPALDHLSALACALTGADAAAVVFLNDTGSAQVLGQDGVGWKICPLNARQVEGQAPLGQDHPLRSGAVDRLATIGLWPLRIDGALVGALLAGQRGGSGTEAPSENWAEGASPRLRPLADLAATQIAAELAMARLARMAGAALGRGEDPP